MSRGGVRWAWLVLLAMHGVVTHTASGAGHGAQPPSVPDRAGDIAMHVRAYADARVPPATLPRAHAVARRILDSAGLAIAWRLCGVDAPCPPEPGMVHELVVILSSHPRPDGLADCGRAARGDRASEGTIVVSVPCVRDVVQRLSRPARNHAHPLLASARYEDLVGAVIAHEIGHLLGMGHATTGLMRAQLGAAEVIALGMGTLGFSEPEAALLRARATLAKK